MLGMLAGAALRSLVLAAVVGAALWLRRTCNPRVSLLAWSLVLAASLSMPAATRMASITLPHGMIQVARLPLTPEIVTHASVMSMISHAQKGVSAALSAAPDCYWFVLLLYIAVFGVLMLRLIVGLLLSWRIVRRATPISDDWVGKFDVRVSRSMDAPATFGSVIMLPNDYTAWTTAKRLAVLAHEGSHVARGDFAIQLAAAVNRMIFWFNPFTWWLQRHLRDLAEAASDDAAIAGLGDRLAYAEILLEFSGGVPRLPGAVAMARRSAVAVRIERILLETPAPAAISQRGRAMMAAGIVPLTILLSCIIISPSPLSKEIPSMANVADVKAAATVAAQPATAFSLAAVIPEMALPSYVFTEGVAVAMPAGAPSERNPEARISPRPPALAPARSSAPPAQTPTQGPPRRASYALMTNAVTGPASPHALDVAKTHSYATSAQGPVTKRTDWDGEPPLFEKLANATCGAVDLLKLGPAYLTPREGPAYLAKAHFFRSRDGRPWVTLYYTGTQTASLPVTIKGGEIEFARSHDMVYTLSPSHIDHRINFAKHPDAGAVDFACWGENPHPL